MPARRRRTGSENEQPFVVVTENSTWPQQAHSSWSSTSHNVPRNESYSDLLSDIEPIEPVMTSRDRTNEFVTAIRSMQGRNIARAVAVRDPRKAKVIQTHSEFMHIAKSIGKNIASTYTKLEKLTLCRCLFHKFIFYYN